MTTYPNIYLATSLAGVLYCHKYGEVLIQQWNINIKKKSNI